jgi:RimJ/RimL family protein N-acetyltransferase
VIETERLILRRWRDEDREPYAELMADEAVAGWLGGVLTRPEADARIGRSEATFESLGMGRWALERRADGRFLGYCGLMPVHESLPEFPGVEIGWALAQHAWGQGYAIEAARAALADGFARLRPKEILAYTTVGNERSQGVMRRLGLRRAEDRDFDHPTFEPSHPLCRHLVYVADRPS